MSRIQITLETQDVDKAVDELLIARVKHLLRNDEHIKKLIEDTVDREVTRKVRSSINEAYIKERVDKSLPKQSELYGVAYKEVIRLVNDAIKPVRQDLSSLFKEEIEYVKELRKQSPEEHKRLYEGRFEDDKAGPKGMNS